MAPSPNPNRARAVGMAESPQLRELSSRLRPYQREGVQFLTMSRSALLADEMGLGKTVQVAMALRELHAQGLMRRALIVAPASLLTNWCAELGRWGPPVALRSTQGLDASGRETLWKLPVPLTVTSYEALRSDFLPVAPLKHLDLVVFDEAQRLKNPQTDSVLAAHRVPADRLWALSATPLENGISDLMTLAKVLQLLPRRATEPSLAVLLESLQGNFLRRRKSDVLPELPAVLVQDIPLSLTSRQEVEYLEARRDFDVGKADSSELLVLINTLKQICNQASDGSSSKLDFLLDILHDPGISDARIIVVSQYTKTLDWLSRQLPVRCVSLTGSLSYRERDGALLSFRDGPTPVVLLLSLKAGGVGLNIPEATHAILFDRWWNAAAESQAIHRAHRFGRELPLHVFRFRVVGSIEDRIVELSSGRQQLFDEVVEESLSPVVVGSGGLTREALAQLLE